MYILDETLCNLDLVLRQWKWIANYFFVKMISIEFSTNWFPFLLTFVNKFHK
jgi:hypothetical protein